MVQAVQKDPEADFFPVFEENWDAVMMFLRLQTQWHVIPGGFTGLNYQSAEFLIKIHGVENPAAMMDDLQTMEVAALQVLNQSKD